ncbi:MAG TPA: hypothetical protein VJZ71_19770 [Phycisphaerae bacterium]|nr:hypothetical protein [Phycisphaerae bacterium]
MMKTYGKYSYMVMCAGLVALAAGCNSPAGMAVQLVGKAVDSVETQKYGDELEGQPPSAADAKFGQPNDVFAEVGGSRKWRVYPGGATDVLGNERYVVEISRERIVGVTKEKLDSSGIDLARKLLLDQKAEGKSPQECEAALGLGRPLLTVRSETTNTLAQLYDARMIEGIGSPKYCRLKFDPQERCNEVDLVDVAASAGSAPPA